MKPFGRSDLLILFAILFILFGVTYCKHGSLEKNAFTVIYSNDVLGESEPCG